MQKVIWLDSAVNDIVRLRQFIVSNNPEAASKAAQIIKTAANKLAETPNIGKPVADLPDYRDLYIRFGAAGYIMRYRIYLDGVYIIHIRHYRESGFKNE
ncbi:MAG: type II toxin-antitoxin system RelE/ParE family toxin [Gammaproteobacteria bacterium]|nr:type II toxin-antitoxin system RelE/ParE family toxin [Gammaproteobacteria bacterium]